MIGFPFDWVAGLVIRKGRMAWRSSRLQGSAVIVDEIVAKLVSEGEASPTAIANSKPVEIGVNVEATRDVLKHAVKGIRVGTEAQSDPLSTDDRLGFSPVAGGVRRCDRFR